MTERLLCLECRHGVPQSFCWEGRVECVHRPPRYMSNAIWQLWRYARGLEARITVLEELFERERPAEEEGKL
jgi:hypothetical protein